MRKDKKRAPHPHPTPPVPASLTLPLAPSTQPRGLGGGSPGVRPRCPSGAQGRWSIPLQFLGAGAPGLGRVRSTCRPGRRRRGSRDLLELARSPPREQNKSTRTCRLRPAPLAGQSRGVGGAWAGPARQGGAGPAPQRQPKLEPARDAAA